MPTERITFDGLDGEALAARLDLPMGPHLATALFAHCFTCGKDIHAARRIAQRLAAMGIAVLRFDFTGLGHSQGEYANSTLRTRVGDLEAAARFLDTRGMAPGLLVGHSLGGLATLHAAPRIASARAVVTIGTAFEPARLTQRFAQALPQIAAEGRAQVEIGGRPFTLGQGLVDDLMAESLTDTLARLDRVLLVLHAPGDTVVPISDALRLFEAARQPKSLVTLDGADHLVSREEDAEYAAGVIAAWARRALRLAPPAPPPGAPEGITRVAEAGVRGCLQDITSGPYHHALADEPLAYGGSNRGMSPYGFVAAGLGACTSMTIRLYARRKGWPLEHVSVDVSHDKVHAQDAGGGDGRLDRFVRRIILTGDLSTVQRHRLMEIADRCPVHRTLESGARIETELA
ncbi:bifunctional alpha/beta hydrolase/OsmC family protein [Sagittula salina]|uniref:Alpha/beta fold hydrolase n=1 Tax=Sagittula salina TaxID=2820268 RepID=A0A940S2J9_9RHOB|nr:bifunctional alpha/beta hydrolase/OsmC family protein [Sagittula salina]MBP0481745.1 alpha/beta fold hydrolase [Sagittula salina]